MLSRIAESLYWIGRYVERAEDTARITDVNFHHTLEMGTSDTAQVRRGKHWDALITIVGDKERFYKNYQDADDETVPFFLTFSPQNPLSIVSCVALARENARTMRHQLGSEMWEVLNRFYLDLQRHAQSGEAQRGEENAHNFYRWVIEFSHLFQGITDSTMPRDEGWYFLQLGKFLERAEKTARALDAKYHLLIADSSPEQAAQLASADAVPRDWHQWLALLRSLSAYEAYNKIYRSAVRPRATIEMLTLSPIFPRSIRFAIDEVDSALHFLATHMATNPEDDGYALLGMGRPSEAERAVGRLKGVLAYQRVEEVFEAGMHAYLLDLQRQCYRIGELIEAQYFTGRVLRAEEVVV